ncbi:hypothetical protein BDQ17DRAFT_1372935 [Cyathus striatus]|nr:hypothetical protein BDQ17DRAFT_1372935 [Cyathus striatus]
MGFDLSQMSWGAFRHKRMFDPRWHLRKERFVLYQLAMIIGLIAESVATSSLSKYNHHQTHLFNASGGLAIEHNNDIIAAYDITIVFCAFLATFFGAEFFFLLFWPTRRYAQWWRVTKKALAVIITIGMAVACILSTVVVATHEATVSGVSDAQKQQLLNIYFRPPLRYRSWAPNVVYVVFLWISFVFTVASTVVMFISVEHDERYGAEPREPGFVGDDVEHGGIEPLPRSEK